MQVFKTCGRCAGRGSVGGRGGRRAVEKTPPKPSWGSLGGTWQPDPVHLVELVGHAGNAAAQSDRQTTAIAARCALPPVAPALSPPACIANGRASPATCSVGVHRLSVIPRALVDRSNPPPESDDDEGDGCLEYDVYGWFKFESDADGVQRLDRQWVPLHDLEQAEGWKAAVLKFE